MGDPLDPRKEPKAFITKTFGLPATGKDYDSYTTATTTIVGNYPTLAVLIGQHVAGVNQLTVNDGTPLAGNVGWEAGDTLTLDDGGGDEETHTVASRLGDVITLTANLANTHAGATVLSAGVVVEMYAGFHSVIASSPIDGSTTNVDYFCVFRPATGEGGPSSPFSGIPLIDGSVVALNVNVGAVSEPISVLDPFSQLQDVVLKVTINHPSSINVAHAYKNGGVGIGIMSIDAINIGASGRLDDCGITDGSGVINCLSVRPQGIAFEGISGTTFAYNCDVIDPTLEAFRRIGGTFLVKNGLASGVGSQPNYVGATLTTSLSDDGSGTAGLINKTPTFIDPGNDDYHLLPGDGWEQGTRLDFDLVFPFSYDVDGDFISPPWNIGFDGHGIIPTTTSTTTTTTTSSTTTSTTSTTFTTSTSSTTQFVNNMQLGFIAFTD